MTTTTKRAQIIRAITNPHVKAWFIDGSELLYCSACYDCVDQTAAADVPLQHDELCALWVQESGGDTTAPFPTCGCCGTDLGGN